MIPVRSTLCAAALACIYALPASAGDFDPVAIDVLQGWDLPDGRRVAALRMELEPGWKTYWRAPGDAGIPPEFDWSRARNIADIEMSWPTPTVYDQNGLRSLGYSGQFVLPMFITPKTAGDRMRLRTTISMGVCADVCVPHRVSVDAWLDASDTGPTPAIVAALAAAPYAASEADVSQAICRVAPSDHGMTIETHVTLPHTGGTEIAVIEPGIPGVWVSEARTRRQGDTVIASSEMIHPDGGVFAVNRSDVRITILGAEYAVDIRGCTGS